MSIENKQPNLELFGMLGVFVLGEILDGECLGCKLEREHSGLDLFVMLVFFF